MPSSTSEATSERPDEHRVDAAARREAGDRAGHAAAEQAERDDDEREAGRPGRGWKISEKNESWSSTASEDDRDDR